MHLKMAAITTHPICFPLSNIQFSGCWKVSHIVFMHTYTHKTSSTSFRLREKLSVMTTISTVSYHEMLCFIYLKQSWNGNMRHTYSDFELINLILLIFHHINSFSFSSTQDLSCFNQVGLTIELFMLPWLETLLLI